MSFITTENISFCVGNRTILQPTNLKFEEGLVYGLIGHNGSAKSTLLKIIANQQREYQGNILLRNKPLSNYSTKEFAKEIAYLPQILPNTTHLSVKELVYMGRYAHKRGFFNQKKDLEIVEQSLKITQTEKFTNQEVETLSGGEKSRVFLAMLLAQESQFLLLDEPLAPLDICYQIEVMELIATLSKKFNKGIIIVIHDINLAATYCDYLVALKHGVVLFNDKATKIMDAKLLESIFDITPIIINHPVKNKKVAIF